jgi:uncharacterized protein (TIRG00374 family)
MVQFFKGASLVAGIAAVVLLCARFGLDELRAAFAQITAGNLCAYLGVGSVVRLGYSLRWSAVAGAIGMRPPLARLVGARLAGDAVGALLPGGRVTGDPLRAALMHAGGVGGVHAAAGVAIDRGMELIGNTVVVVTFVSIFTWARGVAWSPRSFQAVIGTMVVCLVALIGMFELLRRGKRPFTWWLDGATATQRLRRRRWLRALRQTEDQLTHFLRAHPLTFACGLAGSLLIEALIAAEYYFLFATFGLALDLPTLLMAIVAGGLARVVPTPAGLGTIEASQVTVLAVASGRPDVGFVVGMVVRLHETLWTLLGLGVLVARGASPARLRSQVAGKATA